MLGTRHRLDCQNTDIRLAHSTMQDQDNPQARPGRVWPVALAPWREVLMADSWFAQVPIDFRGALMELGHVVTLGDGQALFARGQAAEGLCCVLDGALRVGAVQADGSESLLAFVEPGQWIGEISLIDGRPRTHDAVADGPTRLWLVPQASLQAWLASHPVHWQAIARLACAKLRMLFGVVEDIAHLPLQGRLAKRLWLVAHGYGGRAGAPRQVLHLPQEQLALMLGVSRQSANKALRALESQGLIALRYSTIELLDLPALAALGERPASV